MIEIIPDEPMKIARDYSWNERITKEMSENSELCFDIGFESGFGYALELLRVNKWIKE